MERFTKSYENTNKWDSEKNRTRFQRGISCGNTNCKNYNGRKFTRYLSKIEDSPTDQELEAHFRAKGWVVGAHPDEHRCPDCAKEIANRAVQKSPEHATKPVTWETLDEGKRRSVMAALFERYDVGKGKYYQGESDETVAKEAGVMWGVVRKAREVNGFPDPRRDDVDKASKELDRIKQSIASIRSALDKAEQDVVECEKFLTEI